MILKAIKKEMQHLKIGPTKLAIMTGISRVTLSKWINGHVKLSEQNLIKVMKSLNIEPVKTYNHD